MKEELTKAILNIILAEFPEETPTDTARKIVKKIHDWGNEDCPHDVEQFNRLKDSIDGLWIGKKHQCKVCWSELLKEAGE